MQSATAARERPSTEEVSVAAETPSAGGRWWLQSWFPDWSGWYGTQELTEQHAPVSESSCVNPESEKALGNDTHYLFITYIVRNTFVSFLYITRKYNSKAHYLYCRSYQFI